MKRVKLFAETSSSSYYIVEGLQKQIDKWMEENPSFAILEVSSSSSDNRTIVTILYSDGTLPDFTRFK